MNKKHIGIGIIILFLIIGGIWFHSTKKMGVSLKETKTIPVDEEPLNILTVDQINSKVDEILDILMRLHYISLRDREIENPESLIAVESEEAMNDVNKLRNLKYRTEPLVKSGNLAINTTALSLDVSVASLIDVNNKYISFLRGIDISNINVPEFQYQITLFRTSSHDIYMRMAEGVSLLPMITVEFADNEGEQNKINDQIKNHFLLVIDNKFNEILAKDEVYYKETKLRNVVPVIINGYKSFFN